MNFHQLRESEQDTLLSFLMVQARTSGEENDSWVDFFRELTACLLKLIPINVNSAERSIAIIHDDEKDNQEQLASLAELFALNPEGNHTHHFLTGALFCISTFTNIPEEVDYLIVELLARSVKVLQAEHAYHFLTTSICNAQAAYGGCPNDFVPDEDLDKADEKMRFLERVHWVFDYQ